MPLICSLNQPQYLFRFFFFFSSYKAIAFILVRYNLNLVFVHLVKILCWLKIHFSLHDWNTTTIRRSCSWCWSVVTLTWLFMLKPSFPLCWFIYRCCSQILGQNCRRARAANQKDWGDLTHLKNSHDMCFKAVTDVLHLCLSALRFVRVELCPSWRGKEQNPR